MDMTVSVAMEKHKKIGHMPAHGSGDETRLIYNSAESGKSGPTPIRKALIRYLSLDAAVRLVVAVTYGASLHPTWRSLTINLDFLSSPQRAGQTLRVLTDALRHWQVRYGAPPLWVWVRERGARLGDHVHLLAAVPPGTGRALSVALRKWLRGPSIRGDVPRGTYQSRPTTPVGWLVYTCKTIAPADVNTLYQQTGLRVSSVSPGGIVVGQRIGIARRLGPKARMQYPA